MTDLVSDGLKVSLRGGGDDGTKIRRKACESGWYTCDSIWKVSTVRHLRHTSLVTLLCIIICCRMKAWVDLTLMSLTFILSIIWNIEVGVVVSLVISLLMVVHRSSKTRMTILVCGDEFFVPCYVSIYYRAVFPVPTDGNRSKKILKQRKVWQELSLFKFGKICISVGCLTSFFARQNFLCYLFAIANTAQLKDLSIKIKTSNHSYPNPRTRATSSVAATFSSSLRFSIREASN